MDCETFDAALIDALYDELDEVRARAMERHAEGCAACAAKLADMRATRGRAPRSYLIEEPPSGFENRILAAVDEALAKQAPAPKEEPKSGGAKIFAFVARPQFAIAAAFLLLLGGAVVITSQSMKADTTAAQSASPAAREEDEEQSKAEAKPMATTTPTAAASMAHLDPAPPPAAAAPALRGGGDSDEGKKTACTQDLARLEELAKTDGETELEVARCIAQTQGCKAAVGRFDSAAKRNAGTETGSRATLEAARCYEKMGDVTNAQARYAALARDSYVASEANDSLEQMKAKVKAAKPATTQARPPATATQKAPPPTNVVR